jgi:hypothetical protein
MDWDEAFNDVIHNLRPEWVPSEFIISIKYTDRYGIDHVLFGAELLPFMANPQHLHGREAQIMLDITKLRRFLHLKVIDFFVDLNELIAHK